MSQHAPAPDADSTARAALALGRELSPRQAQVLAGYLGLVERFRTRVNLVGPSDWRVVLETLVADSWHLADFLAGEAASAVLPPPGAPLVCLDFGAGAGLPGLPLRAFWERGPYWLLEARQKRCVFLSEAVARLGLAGLRVAEGDVRRTVPDILAREPGAFVLCLGRAFAPWARFLALCRELVRPPMAVLAMTGAPCPAGETPDGFALGAEAAYAVAGKTRYLSLFAAPAASM